MTFEGFDAAPLIESGGFMPAMPSVTEAGAPDAATLDAALRAAARAERAEMRAEASILDLWVERPGLSNFRVLEGPAFGAGTSRLAWAPADDGAGVLDLSAAKSIPLFAAFGDGDESEDEEIIVKGNRTKNTGTGDETGGGYGDGSYGDNDGGQNGDLGGAPLITPSCANSNEITGMAAPDGAKYMVPEDITAADLQAAINHVVDVAREGKGAVLRAIYNMYENPGDSHFIDFKDWGTSNGPAGSEGAGSITYFSTSLGHNVTSNAFEAFGNYFFGLVCTMAGLSPEETWAIAALSQSGRLNEIANGDLTAIVEAMIYGDDPQDRPFVNDGIADAQAYIASPEANGHQFGVKEGTCGQRGA